VEIGEVDPNDLVLSTLLRDVSKPELESVKRAGLDLALQLYVVLFGGRAFWLGSRVERFVGSGVLVRRLNIQFKALVRGPLASPRPINSVHSDACFSGLTDSKRLQGNRCIVQVHY
jgi:hypothetical protein